MSPFDIPPVHKLIKKFVSEYYFDDIISKMYRIYITPMYDNHVPPVINNTNYNTIDYVVKYEKNTQREPISIVSFLRRSDVNFNINDDVNKFVDDVYNVKTNISNDITYILSCAILIQLNLHYQNVIDWTINLRMVPNWSEVTYPRKIDTAWTFPDFPDTGSQEIKKSYTNDLNRRLMKYHENLDNIDKKRDENDFIKYLKKKILMNLKSSIMAVQKQRNRKNRDKENKNQKGKKLTVLRI